MINRYLIGDKTYFLKMICYNKFIMNKNNLFNTLLTANTLYEKHSRNYRRLILLNILLYVAIVLAAVFTFVNIFQLGNYIVAGMDLLVFSSLVFASYDIHKNKYTKKAAYIFVMTLFVFLLSFALVNQNNNYGLIWTIFFPLVSILIMDRKRGIIIVNIFYLILFGMAFNGIGTWQDGVWDLISFLRFVAASATLTYITYFMEYSHELSEIQLQLTRKKEAESMKSLHELSVKDALTQLYNRRYLHQIFNKEFQTAKRHKYYFGFFILDIDFFKQYNDTYGHQKGDEVLRSLADALRQYMRRSEDVVFRLGGEEFCGISVSDDESKVQAQLKVLVHAIESLQIEHKSSNISRVLTVSLGVKIINEYDEYSFDRLYKEADEALYKAKSEGRNRIQFA